jgi:D-inositol-3-phosphate glycosyltransferase
MTEQGARLLVIGHWAEGSGLTRMLARLTLELVPRMKIRVLGLVPKGAAAVGPAASAEFYRVPQQGLQFFIHPDFLCKHIDEFGPGSVLVVGPAFMVAPVLRTLQAHRHACDVILYLPIEGELADAQPVRLLDLVDACVLYTKSAQAGLTALSLTAGRRQGPPTFVLGHGVDTHVFAPVHAVAAGGTAVSDRGAVRESLFPEHPHLRDSFFVLNSNRAYGRKRLDLTIAGFAQFSRTRPRACLYLNACGLGAQQRQQLETAVETAGASGRVLINLLNPGGEPLPDRTLNLLYNACEVGVTTAMGEGWGLGTFEHAATGAAQVVPDHTTFQENWRGAATFLPPVGRKHIFYEYTDMIEVGAHDLACELERLYSDPGLLQRMSAAAYSRATEPRFNWSNIGRQLEAILAETACAGCRTLQ